MRLLYMGSPLEAIPPLQKLCELHAHKQVDLVGVVSSKQSGSPSVAEYALKHSLRLFCPLRASSADFIEQLQALDIDVILTAAYGQLLSSEFLALAKRATINIHPSLLPRHRGASPVPAALLAGDQETGVTICFTVKALDAGNIILQKHLPIPPHTDHRQLLKSLFELGANILPAALLKLRDHNYSGTPQDQRRITKCYKIKREDGRIDWQQQADEIYRFYLAFKHWPEIFTYWNGRRVVLKRITLERQEQDSRGEHVAEQHAAEQHAAEQHAAEHHVSEQHVAGHVAVCGEFICVGADSVLRVKTGKGVIDIHTLQVEGKKITTASAFANRVRQQNCYRFTLDAEHV